MNIKAQSSIEFLFVIVFVLVLVVVVFASLPDDSTEIVALGIAKNNVDEFILKTNYLGDYNLGVTLEEDNLKIKIYFFSTYSNDIFPEFADNIVSELKNVVNFQNVYIYYN